MNSPVHSWVLVGLILVFSSCAGLQRAAVGTSAKVIYSASVDIESEDNWELFRKGVPANLKLLESLLSVSPNNRELLVSVIKGYVGYAFAVHETLHLEERLSNSGERFHLEQAMKLYSRALNYGWHYLELRGVKYEELVRGMRQDKGIEELLAKNLSSRRILDREAVFFTAQALGSLINLQREDMVLVGQLPVAKEMFDWVCEHDPDISFGACSLFYGAYEAGRPAMLGGNPAKGKKIFKKGIEQYPDNWLVPLSFIQFYALPLYDEEVYQEWRPKFEQWEREFKTQSLWRPPMMVTDEGLEPRLKLYRAIAMKRFAIIKKYERELF